MLPKCNCASCVSRREAQRRYLENHPKKRKEFNERCKKRNKDNRRKNREVSDEELDRRAKEWLNQHIS